MVSLLKKKEVKIPKSPGLPATHTKNIAVLRFKRLVTRNIQPFGTAIFMSYSENNETKYLQMSRGTRVKKT